MSKPDTSAPPPPPPPSYKELWKEYSSWTARSKGQLEKGVSDVRAKMSMAGADKSVIDAAIADRQATYDSEIKKYQASSTYKLLQEGYDIARGAKANPYSGKAKGQIWLEPQQDAMVENPNANAGKVTGAAGSKGERAITQKFGSTIRGKKGGVLNTLEGFYGSGYESGAVEVDAKAEALKKSKLNAGGSGGTAALTGYEKQKEPGTNPWVV